MLVSNSGVAIFSSVKSPGLNSGATYVSLFVLSFASLFISYSLFLCLSVFVFFCFFFSFLYSFVSPVGSRAGQAGVLWYKSRAENALAVPGRGYMAALLVWLPRLPLAVPGQWTGVLSLRAEQQLVSRAALSDRGRGQGCVSSSHSTSIWLQPVDELSRVLRDRRAGRETVPGEKLCPAGVAVLNVPPCWAGFGADSSVYWLSKTPHGALVLSRQPSRKLAVLIFPCWETLLISSQNNFLCSYIFLFLSIGSPCLVERIY